MPLRTPSALALTESVSICGVKLSTPLSGVKGDFCLDFPDNFVPDSDLLGGPPTKRRGRRKRKWRGEGRRRGEGGRSGGEKKGEVEGENEGGEKGGEVEGGGRREGRELNHRLEKYTEPSPPNKQRCRSEGKLPKHTERCRSEGNLLRVERQDGSLQSQLWLRENGVLYLGSFLSR